MAQKTIHPTKHAIDRFAQRVLPHLPKKSRNKMKKNDRIKQSLYRLIRRTEITGKEGQLLHVQTFFTIQGFVVVPLTLVIDLVNRTLCTLYISPGWQNIGNDENSKWMWCQ